MASEKYIVVFKDSASEADVEKHVNEVAKQGGEVTHRYDSALKGFAGHITDEHIQQLQSFTGDDGIIDYIERDSVVTTM